MKPLWDHADMVACAINRTALRFWAGQVANGRCSVDAATDRVLAVSEQGDPRPHVMRAVTRRYVEAAAERSADSLADAEEAVRRTCAVACRGRLPERDVSRAAHAANRERGRPLDAKAVNAIVAEEVAWWVRLHASLPPAPQHRGVRRAA